MAPVLAPAEQSALERAPAGTAGAAPATRVPSYARPKVAGAHTFGSGVGRLDVDGVQLALLRQATVARRISLARSLSRTTTRLARRAIRRAHPGASEREVALAFVAVHYGQDLADRLRARLAAGP